MIKIQFFFILEVYFCHSFIDVILEISGETCVIHPKKTKKAKIKTISLENCKPCFGMKNSIQKNPDFKPLKFSCLKKKKKDILKIREWKINKNIFSDGKKKSIFFVKKNKRKIISFVRGISLFELNTIGTPKGGCPRMDASKRGLLRIPK